MAGIHSKISNYFGDAWQILTGLHSGYAGSASSFSKQIGFFSKALYAGGCCRARSNGAAQVKVFI